MTDYNQQLMYLRTHLTFGLERAKMALQATPEEDRPRVQAMHDIIDALLLSFPPNKE